MRYPRQHPWLTAAVVVVLVGELLVFLPKTVLSQAAQTFPLVQLMLPDSTSGVPKPVSSTATSNGRSALNAAIVDASGNQITSFSLSGGTDGNPFYVLANSGPYDPTRFLPVSLYKSDGSGPVPTDISSTSVTSSPNIINAITANTSQGVNETDMNVPGQGTAFVTVNCNTCSGGTTVSLYLVDSLGNNVTPNSWQTNTTATGYLATTTTAGKTYWRVPLAGATKLGASVTSYSAGTITVTATVVPISMAPPFLTAAPAAATVGGCPTPYHYIAAASSNQDSQNIKSSAGQLYLLAAENMVSALRYVKVYDATSPTSGSTPKFTFLVPHNSGNGAGFMLPIPIGVQFTTGISFRMTTGLADNDANAVTANDLVLNACVS